MTSQKEQQQQQQEQQQQTSSCPYAKAIQNSDSCSSQSPLPGLVELKDCPAFTNTGGCPFKDAKSAEEISAQLKHIPPSHLQKNGTFFKTLQFFHGEQILRTSDTPGACPVKNALPQTAEWSFDRAMEEYSLAAIMSRLAQEWEDKEGGLSEGISQDLSQNASEVITTAPPSIVSSTIIDAGSGNRKSPRLSDALKSGTAVAHEAAESVHFVKNFIRGKIDRQLYGLLVAQLYYVYQNLEKALDEHAPKLFPTCHFSKELYRTEALEEDLEFWHAATPAISPAAQDYLDRLDHLCQTNPLLLLSHAYTRYLGDLSGGKVLSRVARKAMSLSHDGLAFYEFPHVESFKLFKDQYRACLNDLPLNEEQVQDLVQEANVAFLLNMRLFEELDVLGGVRGASIRPLEAVYSVKYVTPSLQSTAISGSEEAAPCPFMKETSGSTGTTIDTKKHGTCPWPFILLHDPKTGFKAWQTWLVMGILLACVHHYGNVTTI